MSTVDLIVQNLMYCCWFQCQIWKEDNVCELPAWTEGAPAFWPASGTAPRVTVSTASGVNVAGPQRLPYKQMACVAVSQ